MNSHTNLAKNHSLIVGVEMVQKKCENRGG